MTWHHHVLFNWPFVRVIHQWLVDSPHKGPVMQKPVPFLDIIMCHFLHRCWVCRQYGLPQGSLLWLWVALSSSTLPYYSAKHQQANTSLSFPWGLSSRPLRHPAAHCRVDPMTGLTDLGDKWQPEETPFQHTSKSSHQRWYLTST